MAKTRTPIHNSDLSILGGAVQVTDFTTKIPKYLSQGTTGQVLTENTVTGVEWKTSKRIQDSVSVNDSTIVVGGTTVTLSQTIDTTSPLEVYRNSILLRDIVDYTRVGQIVTFVMPFIVQDEIDIFYKQ